MLDESQRLVFLQQFRLMHNGKTNGKHEVPGTTPKLWALDAGSSGKVYCRRGDGDFLIIELVGFKHRQDFDYAWLRNQDQRNFANLMGSSYYGDQGDHICGEGHKGECLAAVAFFERNSTTDKSRHSATGSSTVP
ncbi:MAG: hypothetical protein WCA10_13405 [Terracidiphilus sp.]